MSSRDCRTVLELLNSQLHNKIICWSIAKLVVNNQDKIMIIKLTNRNHTRNYAQIHVINFCHSSLSGLNNSYHHHHHHHHSHYYSLIHYNNEIMKIIIIGQIGCGLFLCCKILVRRSFYRLFRRSYAIQTGHQSPLVPDH